MPMDSVSEENVAKLLKEHNDKQQELENVKNTSIQQMWINELDILKNEYQEYQKERQLAQLGETNDNKKSNKKTISKKSKKIILIEGDK
jgi:hypothetical protein